MGLGCMGMSEFYGSADEQQGIDTIHRALDLGVTFLDTADMYGPFTNEQLVGKAIAGPPRRGAAGHQVRQRAQARRHPRRHQRPAGVRPGRLRRLPAAPRGRPHRPLLPAPRRQDRPDRGDRRRDGRARPGRQGPPPRPLRGLRRQHPQGPRAPTRSPRCRPSTRCSPATSRTRSSRSSASWASGWSPTPRSAAASSPARSAPAPCPPTTPATAPTSRASTARPGGQPRLVDKVTRIAEEKAATPGQLSLAWVLAQGDDIVPIPGTKRLAYLEENAGAADVTSPPTTWPRSTRPSRATRWSASATATCRASTPDQVEAIPIRPSRKASTNSAWSWRTRAA